MTKPVRLQLSRLKGFDLQAASLAANGLPAVNVARPTKWGNPFRVGDRAKADPDNNVVAVCMSNREAVDTFRAILETQTMAAFRAEIAADLAGMNLACWCKQGEPCHADVLLEIANRLRCDEVGR